MTNDLRTNKKTSLPWYSTNCDSTLNLSAFSADISCFLNYESNEYHSRTMCVPFMEVEEKLSLMFRSMTAEKGSSKEVRICSELNGRDVSIAFPSIVFYTVMEELIENSFNFSSWKSPVKIIFSEVENKLGITIINRGSFSDLSLAQVKESGNKQHTGIGLHLTDKLCKYYNSHFAIYQSNEDVIIILEIPINFK